jgi:excisionase family DNA binding protein
VLGKVDAMPTKRRSKVEPAPIGEHLLTIREAAEVLRLHPRTVRDYVRRRELEGRIIGRRWRFRRMDLDAFYENAPCQWDLRRKGEDEE